MPSLPVFVGIIILLLGNSLQAQTPQKIIKQSIEIPEDCERLVVITKNCPMYYRYGEDGVFDSETNVKLSMGNQALLNYLEETGRYRFYQEYNPSRHELKVYVRGTSHVVMLKGDECYEDIIHTLYIPLDFSYMESSSSNEFNRIHVWENYRARQRNNLVDSLTRKKELRLSAPHPTSLQVKLYPVPAKDQLQISFEQVPVNASDAVIRILDLQGRLLLEQKTPAQQGQLFPIQLSNDWPAGNYILQIELEDGTNMSQQFIIQD